MLRDIGWGTEHVVFCVHILILKSRDHRVKDNAIEFQIRVFQNVSTKPLGLRVKLIWLTL